MGVSPIVGGLRGSATWIGRPNGDLGSLGNIVARGEKNPERGGVGASPYPDEDDEVWINSWKGLLVMASARGDITSSSSEYDGATGAASAN